MYCKTPLEHVNSLSQKQVFPVEILELIFQELGNGDRFRVLLSSKHFHAIASRLQYRSITSIANPCQFISLFKILSKNVAYATFVRHLVVDLHPHQVTGNLLRLLNRALRQLSSLQTLSIEFSPRDNEHSLTCVFDGCTFTLRTLTTSVCCDEPLARFLETQTQLTELSLRGFQTTSPFVIAPSAMPHLSVFRTVHAGVPVLAQILPGRPIEAVSLSLFSDEGFASLHTLVPCRRTIKKLTVMSLDCTPLDEIIPEVASRVPDLEALHIIVLMAPCTSVSPLGLPSPPHLQIE